MVLIQPFSVQDEDGVLQVRQPHQIPVRTVVGGKFAMKFSKILFHALSRQSEQLQLSVTRVSRP
jgi:hypothetical protein